MAGSDIIATTIQDGQTASTTFVAAAANPTVEAGYTIANGSFTNNHGRFLTVTTTGTSDNGKTITIVGTDIRNNVMSEVIQSTGSAETVTGTKYFKTIVSATPSAQYANNASIGMTVDAAATFFNERSRLKAFTTIATATAGVIEFLDGTPESGTIVFKTKTSGVNNAADDVYIPEEGVLFKTSLSVVYSISHAHMITAFHA